MASEAVSDLNRLKASIHNERRNDMTGEEMERAIEVLLEQNARFGAAIEKATESIQRLGEVQTNTSKELQQVGEAHVNTSRELHRIGEAQAITANDMQILTGKVLELTDAVSRLEMQAETDRQEIREAINNLIVANEVTRSLGEDVARLAINTKQRVTDLESKLP